MFFERLTLDGWRQFAQADISFHRRLTILTGANATGKTTILNVLNQQVGWYFHFIAGLTELGRRLIVPDLWRVNTSSGLGDLVQIGTLAYTNGRSAKLSIPTHGIATYGVLIDSPEPVNGIFIPSHRAPFYFEQVEYVPTRLYDDSLLLANYLNELRLRYQSILGNAQVRSPSYRLKEALISLATFGYGNQAVSPTPQAALTFETFQDVLRSILPTSLGFDQIKIRPPDVALITRTGEFSIDAVSGGLSALIDLAWQVHVASRVYPSFVVIIDEPENHLHPELQRTVMPDLLEVFEDTQFIVATHNPFIVGSTPDSTVYVLKYNQDGRVVTEALDWLSKASSANDLLRDALGVPFTMPVWVQERLSAIVRDYATEAFTPEVAAKLREEMAELGLDHLFPEAVAQLVSKS